MTMLPARPRGRTFAIADPSSGTDSGELLGVGRRVPGQRPHRLSCLPPPRFSAGDADRASVRFGLIACSLRRVFRYQPGELHARADIELPEDMTQVKRNRVGAQEHLSRYLAVAEPLCYQIGNSPLGICQARPAEGGPVSSLPVVHPYAAGA